MVQTALALVATNVGGGILGLPFAFYRMGLPVGLSFCAFVAFMCHISSMMYLMTKDLTPGKFQSAYEIAYLLFGRLSIFVVCIIQWLNNYGAILLYYIIIGETVSTLSRQVLTNAAEGKSFAQLERELQEYPWLTQVATSKMTGIIIVGTVHISAIFKRQLHELRCMSYMLAAIGLVFVSCVVSQLLMDRASGREMPPSDELMTLKVDYHLITSVCVTFFAYGYQFLILPAYSELENRSNSRFGQSSLLAVAICSAAFMTTATSALFMFGANLKPDFLLNMYDRTGPISVLCRASYCFVLTFHIPYFFFTIKEYTLVIYDEITNRSLSETLEIKMVECVENRNSILGVIAINNGIADISVEQVD